MNWITLYTKAYKLNTNLLAKDPDIVLPSRQDLLHDVGLHTGIALHYLWCVLLNSPLVLVFSYLIAMFVFMVTVVSFIPLQNTESEYIAAATLTQTATSTPTQTPSPTPTATYTPTATPTLIPSHTPEPAMYIQSDSDVKYLAKLLVSEIRGMPEPWLHDIAFSILSTVAIRMRTGYMSDGTVIGTLMWHSPGNGPYQFPPWVMFGCRFIPESQCLDAWNLLPFEELVHRYLTGERGSCDGYYYYGAVVGWPQLCVIRADIPYAQNWIAFHNGWETSLPIPAPTYSWNHWFPEGSQ